MGFTCRAATPEEDDVIAGMMMQLYVEDPSPHAPSASGALHTLAHLRKEPQRGVVVVLEHVEQIAGYAVLCSFWSNELGGEICVVDEVFVAREHRGRGLASWFMRSLMSRALPFFGDAVAYELEVTSGNPRARALYERMGFAPKKNTTLRALRPR